MQHVKEFLKSMVVAGATNMSSILKAIQQDRAKDVHRNGLSVLPVR